MKGLMLIDRKYNNNVGREKGRVDVGKDVSKLTEKEKETKRDWYNSRNCKHTDDESLFM